MYLILVLWWFTMALWAGRVAAKKRGLFIGFLFFVLGIAFWPLALVIAYLMSQPNEPLQAEGFIAGKPYWPDGRGGYLTRVDGKDVAFRDIAAIETALGGKALRLPPDADENMLKSQLVFSFQGRINSAEYWKGLGLLFIILCSVVSIPFSLSIASIFIPSKHLDELSFAFAWLGTGELLFVSIWPISALNCKRLFDMGFEKSNAKWLVFSGMLLWLTCNLILNPLFVTSLYAIAGLFDNELEDYEKLISWLGSYGFTPLTFLFGISFASLAIIIWLGTAPSAEKHFSE